VLNSLKGILWVLLALTWVTALAFGFRSLWAFQDTPGKTSTQSLEWPRGTRLRLATETPTLVLVAHPMCPCTRASLEELAKLMVSVEGRLKAYVIVADSRIGGPAEKAAVFQRASAIPGVFAVADRDGAYRSLFGAETSGQVYLYDQTGRLRFLGGITAARGHQGPSRGRAAIVAVVNQQRMAQWSSKVFGCLLTKSRRETP
jgi:hypothetical protein